MTFWKPTEIFSTYCMSKKRIIPQIDFQCPGFPEFGWQEHVDILWGIYSTVTQVKLLALGTGLQWEAITQFVTMFPCTLLHSAALYFICDAETCTGVYLVYVNEVTGRLFQECWVRGTGKVPSSRFCFSSRHLDHSYFHGYSELSKDADLSGLSHGAGGHCICFSPDSIPWLSATLPSNLSLDFTSMVLVVCHLSCSLPSIFRAYNQLTSVKTGLSAPPFENFGGKTKAPTSTTPCHL